MPGNSLLSIGTSCLLAALVLALAGCGESRGGKRDAAVDTRPASPDSGSPVEVAAEVDRDQAIDSGVDVAEDGPHGQDGCGYVGVFGQRQTEL